MYFIQSAQSGLSGWRKQSAAKLSLTQLNWFYVLFNIQLIIQSVQFRAGRTAGGSSQQQSSSGPQSNIFQVPTGQRAEAADNPTNDDGNK
jgi:hypothetical protein